MHDKKRLTNFTLCFILVCTSFFNGQRSTSSPDTTSYTHIFGKPLFIYDAFVFTSPEPGHSRLQVYLAFVNDILQFRRNGDNFLAQYEVLVEIFDAHGRYRDGRGLKKKVSTHSYDETNSRHLVIEHQFHFDLPPGAYELMIELTDLDTKRHLRRERDIEVRDLETPEISLSDVIFADSIVLDRGRNVEITPNLNRTFEDPSTGFFGYFEVYHTRRDSLQVTVRLQDSFAREVYSESIAIPPKVRKYQKAIPIRKLLHTSGLFYFIVEARCNNHLVRMKQQFIIQYAEEKATDQDGFPSQAYLNALKYVATAKEYKRFVSASPEARKELIAEFWRQRDPTPATPENELREEFHKRVEFTMRYFSIAAEGRPGWQTDRGKIYILYGKPSDIRRRNVDIDSNPYEFWYYTEIDRRFVFLDKSGLGAYRLVHKD